MNDLARELRRYEEKFDKQQVRNSKENEKRGGGIIRKRIA